MAEVSQVDYLASADQVTPEWPALFLTSGFQIPFQGQLKLLLSLGSMTWGLAWMTLVQMSCFVADIITIILNLIHAPNNSLPSFKCLVCMEELSPGAGNKPWGHLARWMEIPRVSTDFVSLVTTGVSHRMMQLTVKGKCLTEWQNQSLI